MEEARHAHAAQTAELETWKAKARTRRERGVEELGQGSLGGVCVCVSVFEGSLEKKQKKTAHHAFLLLSS